MVMDAASNIPSEGSESEKGRPCPNYYNHSDYYNLIQRFSAAL
jgi:hypothetical protein